METKEIIISIADEFIRDKGYNGFSFRDISKSIGIKTSSIHYHFPSKSDLGISVVDSQIEKLEALKNKLIGQSPLAKLEAFFKIYERIRVDNKICMVGALASDFKTLDSRVQETLKVLSSLILEWVIAILEEGKAQGVFHFDTTARTKAIMVISNMLAIVQLVRLMEDSDFENIKQAIIKELTTQ